jgi:hypothetical protein
MSTTELTVKRKIEKPIVYKIDKELLEKEPFDDKFYINDMNRKEMIKYFEKGIRDSFEYKFLIDGYKMVLDVNACVYFKDYSLKNGMKLEFHHYPFTLYDYTEAIMNKELEKNDGYVFENDVERDVALLHYHLKVGLIPLDPTAHAQYHDGKLDIHPKLIIGNYQEFYNEYKKYISDEAKERYKEFLEKPHDDNSLSYPENFVYKPTVIELPTNKTAVTTEKLNEILLGDKLEHVNNVDISKLLGEKK